MLPRFAASSLALAVVLAPLGACSPTIVKPRLAGPGPAPLQRARSEVYDPYPVADGGPKIVGGRPIDFVTPRNEVTLSRQFKEEQRAFLGTARATPVVLPGAAVLPGASVPVVQGAPTYAMTGQPPAPVVGPAVPTYPSYPTYPAMPVATPALPSTQPPVQYRY